MPAHRGRNSHSTVAAVNDQPIKWIRESAVLKKTPKGVHSDGWSCFVLTDAIVYRKDGKTMTNLLNIDLEGPLIVRGKLDVEEKKQQKLREFPQPRSPGSLTVTYEI